MVVRRKSLTLRGICVVLPFLDSWCVYSSPLYDGNQSFAFWHINGICDLFVTTYRRAVVACVLVNINGPDIVETFPFLFRFAGQSISHQMCPVLMLFTFYFLYACKAPWSSNNWITCFVKRFFLLIILTKNSIIADKDWNDTKIKRQSNGNKMCIAQIWHYQVFGNVNTIIWKPKMARKRS